MLHRCSGSNGAEATPSFPQGAYHCHWPCIRRRHGDRRHRIVCLHPVPAFSPSPWLQEHPKQLRFWIGPFSLPCPDWFMYPCWLVLFVHENLIATELTTLHCSDTARVALVPMLNKFNSMKTNKKGLVAMMEYNTLETATGKFSESNLLGAGGFGCVYKANFEGGLVAAVKRFGHRGQDCEKEFEVGDCLCPWPEICSWWDLSCC